MVAELGVGLHTISVRLDPDNEIQEISARNNFEERALMVLKEGTNVVQDRKTVTQGEVSTDDYVMDGAFIVVMAGGTAEGTLIQGKVHELSLEGNIYYFPGTVYVDKDGLISNAYVYDYGMLLLNGGMAENINVFNDGMTVVNDGSTISGAYVDVNGNLRVKSEGCLTGRIMLETGAKVVFEEGGILNFDLTQTAADGNPMLNDLSLIKGTPTFTLTVSDSPLSGTYSLAEGAAGFDGELSVANPLGAELGVLTVGDTLSIGNANYTLNLTDNLLFVNVTVDKALTGLTGTPEKVSWEPTGAKQYFVEYSTDSFEHVFSVTTSASVMDLMELPAGTYQWRVKANDYDEWALGDAFVSENDSTTPKVVQSNDDGNDDLFFANQSGTWSSRYCAHHVGSINDWTGTDETVSAAGKGRIQNLFFGSADPNVLCLTDSENGDAIFVDDIFTDLPEDVAEHTARLYMIQEIRAGAGDDIVDMTSQQFEYIGDGLTIRGCDGDANMGDNWLFGDAGNDRIVGASGNDIIVGGSGDDSLHGGGGDDIFAFGGDWGNDTVEQCATGSVTLWFQEGDESKWNAQTLTYTDGDHSVKVTGVLLENISLIFGNDNGKAVERHAELLAADAFDEFTSKKIFEDNGVLA